MRWFDSLENFGGSEKAGDGSSEPRPSEPKRPGAFSGQPEPIGTSPDPTEDGKGKPKTG